MKPRTRDKFLMVVALAVSLTGTGALAANYGDNTAPAVESVDLSAALVTDGRWSVQFLGDTMVGDGATPMLDPRGFDAALSAVAPLIDGDFVIANLEAPITLHDQALNPGKNYSYRAEPQAAGALSRAGIDALGLGNNHAMDMGLPGLEETMTLAGEKGMASFGAGRNLAEAERPLILRTDMGTVGVVALGENFGKAIKAAETNPGTVVLSPATVQRGYDLARAAGADWVVAYVHWGDNYTDTNAEQRHWAQVMADAGYDLIVGTGPHIVDKIEFVGDVPVAYSIGNFVFGTAGRYKSFGKPGVGLMLSVEMSKYAPAQLAIKCIVTDNVETGFLTQPCSAPQIQSIIPAIHPALEIQGNVARMPCRCFETPN